MSSKVSVIIPVYNSERYVRECISSVIGQTYKNLEIIIVDDGSTDACLNIIEEEKDERVRIIKFNSNTGVSAARNEGIKNAKGDYICFIDADDIWVKDKIERQINLMEENNYAFTYGNYAFYKNGRVKNIVHVPHSLTYNEAIKNTVIFISTVMLDCKRVDKEDMYMPNLKVGQDTSTWWHILKKGITAYGINETLAYYRVGNSSLSSNKVKAVIGAWKIYKRENIKPFERIYCFMQYIKNAIKRRI